MNAWGVLSYLLLGGLLGAVGQGLRFIVGLKKKYDESSASGRDLKEIFDYRELWLSFVIAFLVGAIAGILGVISHLGEEITVDFLFTIIGIGYVGTDFIEGLIKKKVFLRAR